MRVTIRDATADVYQGYADQQGRGLDAVVEAQLARFAGHAPGTKAIVVNAEDAHRILGGTPVLNGTDLLARVSQLASLSFHGIRLDFSPAQLAELQHRAERQGKTVEVLAADIVKSINREFFWASGGGEASALKTAGAGGGR